MPRRVGSRLQGRVLGRRSSLALAIVVGASLPVGVTSQTAQIFSLQASALGVYPFGGGLAEVTGGFGWEVQARWNPGAFSIGAGGEQTFHEVRGAPGRDIVLTGGFLEPRYVLDFGRDNIVLYVSARVAVSQIRAQLGTFERTGTGFTLNGGGGVLVRLGDRLNLDAGATLGYKELGFVQLPIGPVSLGTGVNIVSRIGLAVGVR
jgi:hypothetical protein